jgi:hypothetical protein
MTSNKTVITDQQSMLDPQGQHRTGKSCQTIYRLSDVDASILGQLNKMAFESMQTRYN